MIAWLAGWSLKEKIGYPLGASVGLLVRAQGATGITAIARSVGEAFFA